MPENSSMFQSGSGRDATRPASAGPTVRVSGPSRRPPPAPEPMALDVLYEDEWLIAVDKPAGMVVHPTYRNWSGTLLNGLLSHLAPGPDRLRQGRVAARPDQPVLAGRSAFADRPGRPPKLYAKAEGPGLRDITPRIVTRLDKDTSGVVLVALGADVHTRIQRDAAAGRVKKEYLAIVCGTPAPPRGSIDAPLARSGADRRRVVVDAAGRDSRTHYEVVSVADEVALVRCELATGRTHQIRVHLASRGWPVAGDLVYGAPHPDLARQALHAWRVTLPHPLTRETLTLEAPLPADMRAAMP